MSTETQFILPSTGRRGRGHPLGYGYIDRITPSTPTTPCNSQIHKQYKKQPEHEVCFQEGQTLATQRIYKKIQPNEPITSKIRPDEERTLRQHDLRIQDNISINDYVETILTLLHEIKYNSKYDMICLLAHSRNICKLIKCVEVLKREIHGLHQLTELTEILVVNEYIALQKGFKTVRNETETSQIEINLSFKNIFNSLHIGYQPPIVLVDANQIKQIYDKKVSDLEQQIKSLEEKINEKMNERLKYKSETESVTSEEGYTIVQEQWGAIDIVNFIVNLDKRVYSKYYEVLLEGLNREGIDGSCLKELTKQDLFRLGVSQFKDRTKIYMSIQKFLSADH